MGSEERNRLGPVGVGWRKMGTGSRPADCGDQPGNGAGQVPVPIFRAPAFGPGLLSSIRTSVNATS